MDKAEAIIKQCEAMGAEHGEYKYAAMCGGLQQHVRMLCAELEAEKRMHTAPSAKGAGEVDYCGFTVHFEYTPEEKATWEEPGTEEGVEIIAVYSGRTDIQEFLADEILEQIKERCLKSINQEQFNNAFDKAEHLLAA